MVCPYSIDLWWCPTRRRIREWNRNYADTSQHQNGWLYNYRIYCARDRSFDGWCSILLKFLSSLRLLVDFPKSKWGKFAYITAETEMCFVWKKDFSGKFDANLVVMKSYNRSRCSCQYFEREIAVGVIMLQGSCCLGPKIYILYVKDTPTFEKINTALYADDTAIYA